ncbi:hypothetical protein [Xylophilus sp. GOD-11R]|uniref:hypothetical protein n=1 Tax=Xylophilus sp. GOD-11R TaxID=3089814 RepID=UPI00298D1986|nr:hypothetical protein [Xylophilus sp. GOD-11R]WPB58581.1 hypothetical protein R9X41_08080 [Xylophilus sp. GOD-11R]
MNSTTKQSLPRNAALLAGLLERLEAGNHADAAQYRDVAARLAAELQSLPRDASTDALLIASPAAAIVYENLYYEQAGLCRTPLEPAMAAELAAREAIAHARRPAASAT